MAELAVITFSVNYLRSHPSHKHQGSMGYTLHFWLVVRNYQCLTHGQACMHSNSQAQDTTEHAHCVPADEVFTLKIGLHTAGRANSS